MFDVLKNVLGDKENINEVEVLHTTLRNYFIYKFLRNISNTILNINELLFVAFLFKYKQITFCGFLNQIAVTI